MILEDLEGPAALVLSRQDLPVLDRETYGAADGVGKGAYVLPTPTTPEAMIIATGSEVWVALAAAEELDVPVRVVSMPSWELFEQQDEDYRDVGPAGRPADGLRRGRRAHGLGALRRRDRLGRPLRRLGARRSVLEELGITPANVAEHVRELLA